jgi:hypothetical protein
MELYLLPGTIMFTDKDEDVEVGGDSHQAVGDQGGGDQEGEASDDELLPNIDLPEVPRCEPSKKKPRQERKEWNWVDGWMDIIDTKTYIVFINIFLLNLTYLLYIYM